MSRSRERERSPYEEDKENNNQIYVGRLPRGIYERDLEEIFSKFGKIKSLLLKRGFAFIVSYKDSLHFYLGVLKPPISSGRNQRS